MGEQRLRQLLEFELMLRKLRANEAHAQAPHTSLASWDTEQSANPSELHTKQFPSHWPIVSKPSFPRRNTVEDNCDESRTR